MIAHSETKSNASNQDCPPLNKAFRTLSNHQLLEDQFMNRNTIMKTSRQKSFRIPIQSGGSK